MSERWDVFEKVLNRSLQDIFIKVSWKKITDQFPQLMDQDVHKRSLKDVHTQVSEWFSEHVNSSLEKVFAEKQLYANLTLLQQCVDDAETRRQKFKNASPDVDELGPEERPLDLKNLSPRDIMACILQNDRQATLETLERESLEMDQESARVNEEIKKTQQQVDELWSQVNSIRDRLNQEQDEN